MVLADDARLALRLPAERIAAALPLTGRTLRVGEHALQVGVPDIRVLIPAADVASRHVIIKGFMEPEPFAVAVRTQLDALEVAGEVVVGARRIQPIHGKRVVGFGVRVLGLSDVESLLLQSRGVGGRRRMGCGLFRPLPKARS